jgi:hypothetical protein
MAFSNVDFYKHVRETLGRRFEHPCNQYLKPYLPAFVQVMRIAVVLRYNTETHFMGTTVSKYDGKLYADEWYHNRIKKVMTVGWFMEIAGTEYMLELQQPGHAEFATCSNAEKYKLSTDTWAVAFSLTAQDQMTAMHANRPLLRYMNRYAILGHYDFHGDIADLENSAAMFTLVSAELAPLPSQGV